MESRTDQEAAPRSILVVDGDAQTQRILDLSLRNAGFEVRTATTGDEALAAIADHEPDLIVSETRLGAGIDGFELCRRIKQRSDRAAVPFLFLSELTTDSKLRGVEAGADDFLGKPLYLQEVVARARTLLQRRERERLEALADGNAPFAGELADIPLADLLRAVQTHRKSGVAHFHAPGGVRGEIYFRQGAAVDAEVGSLSGREAVYRLLAWTAGRFEIEWKSIRRKDVVAMDPAALLEEGLRRQDEWRRLLVDAPRLDTVFEVDYRLLADRLAEIPDEVNSILRLFDGTRTFMRVVNECGLGDLEALGVIGKLYRENIIREAPGKREAGEPARGEGDAWLAESNGPFRSPPDRPRREAPPAAAEPAPPAPARPAPQQEASEALADDARAKFTDRLNTDAPAPAAPPPPALTPQQERAMLASESTLQGFPIQSLPRPITSPGYHAPILPGVPPPRSLPDVTPPTRAAAGPPAAAPAGDGDGIPEPVLPQDGAPGILIPFPAPEESAPPPAGLEEQRAVAGEIVARKPSPRARDSRASLERLTQLRESAAVPLRGTDPGMGPAEPADGEPAERRDGDRPIRLVGRPLGPAGDAAAESDAEVPTAEPLPDADFPEDSGPPSRSRGPLLIGLGMFMAFGLYWLFLRPGHPLTSPGDGAQQSPAAPTATAAAVAPATASPKPEPVAPTAAPSVVPPGPPAATPEAPAHAEPAVHPTSAAPAVAAASLHPTATTPPPSAPPIAEMDERAADPKLAREAPAQFPQLLAACRTAFGEKRMKDAEAACSAARDANPDSAEACAFLAHALFNRHRRRDALMWAERSVKIDPKQADAYVIIGGVHQDAGEKADAKAAYQKYLELAPAGSYAADLRAIVNSL